MSLARLARLLDAAGMPTTRVAAPELRAIVDGVTLSGLVLPEARLIEIGAEIPLPEGAENEDLLELMNQQNGELLVVRCSTLWPTSLLCDHHVGYAEGLPPAQLHHAMTVGARDYLRARRAVQELPIGWGAPSHVGEL